MCYIAYIDTAVSDITLYSCLMYLNCTTYHPVAVQYMILEVGVKNCKNSYVDNIVWCCKIIFSWCTVSFTVSVSFQQNTSSSLSVNRETLDKFIQNVPNSGVATTTLSTRKDLPSPLDPKDYHQVRFWTAKSFEDFCNNLAGETDGLATQQRRRGRCRKSESYED
jgi:hypothetical protein